MGKNSIFTSILMLLLLGGVSSAFAHDARPVAITITEELTGIFQFSVKVPPTVGMDNQPFLIWPESCSSLEGGDSALLSERNDTHNVMRCPTGLSGQSFSLNYPLFNPSLATFYRLTTQDGTTVTSMLTPSEPLWQVPAENSSVSVMKEYLVLGIEHILSGFDHLLFVLGLLVIARTTKRILFTVTGFTLAHSITLSLSAFGFISIPIMPVEATIALSIVFLAYEISREHDGSLTYRFPVIISFGFGLLHGLGFASALGEIGIVPSEILLSLLFFNLGVEFGQIIFILTVFFGGILIYKIVNRRVSMSDVIAIRRVDLFSSYIIGIPAAYWFIERVLKII